MNQDQIDRFNVLHIQGMPLTSQPNSNQVTVQNQNSFVQANPNQVVVQNQNSFVQPKSNQFQNRYNPQQKQYDEKVVKLCGFSFPFNNLLLVSLMKRIPNNTQADYKEFYFGFVTTVLGVGQANNRSYDFNQKIVQKFSLKDLKSLSFALCQLALGNTQVLPFTKFTNSGSGAKTLYLQYKENIENFNNVNFTNHQQQYQTQQSQNTRKMENNIIFGCSFGNMKINIPLTKSDANSIGAIIDKLYQIGIDFETQDQIKLNTSIDSPTPVINSGVQSFPITNPVTIGPSNFGNNIVSQSNS